MFIYVFHREIAVEAGFSKPLLVDDLLGLRSVLAQMYINKFILAKVFYTTRKYCYYYVNEFFKS